MSGIDLPHLTGVIPHDAEQAIARLRAELETLQTKVASLERQLTTLMNSRQTNAVGSKMTNKAGG